MTFATDKVPLRIKLFQGFGSVAYGIKDNGFSTFLLIFYNQVMKVDAALISSALMVVLIVDAFADPIIGHLSDRTYTRWGRRLPWLYAAPIPLAFAWLFLWHPPANLENIFVYLVIVGILVRTLLSCCEVPATSLIPELTHDYDERTVLVRYRYLFGWAGGLLMLYLAYAFFLVPDAEYPVGQLNPNGYWSYGVFGAILMATAVIVSALGQHSRVAHWPTTKPEKSTLKQSLGEIFESLSHPASLILFGAAAVAYTSQGITFSIANYLYLFVWQYPAWAFQAYPWMLFFSVLASFFLVSPLNKRFGKKETAMVCGLLSVSFWIAPFALRLAGMWPEVGTNLSTWLVFSFGFMANVLGVIVMISAQSMVAEIVEASQEQTGRRTEGVFSAGWLFTQKCATGLGIFVTGLIVSWSGLPIGAKPGSFDPAIIDKLTIAYCSMVILAVVISTTIFSRFPISRADHEARLRQLAAASGGSGD